MDSTSFLGFSSPNFFFRNFYFEEPVYYFSRKCWDFLWVFFILFYFSVHYFGLVCDHGNSFLCLDE